MKKQQNSKHRDSGYRIREYNKIECVSFNIYVTVHVFIEQTKDIKN